MKSNAKFGISTLTEFMAALRNPTPATLEIRASILFPFPIILPTGFRLAGIDSTKAILSFSHGDGIGLTADNELVNLTIQAASANRALYTLSDREDLGTLTLRDLIVTGQIQIMTRLGTNRAKLVADKIDIVSCDSRACGEQPQKYGVNVYQGAFTVYNYNGDPESVIDARLTNITIGRKNAPVLGSGLYVSGYGDKGGRVKVDLISTGEIHSNGMISFGTANMITAAVFIVYGAHVRSIVHEGAITTYGVNDMVLDTWGRVDRWVAERPLTSYGPSGIGFVNFGTADYFEAKDKIETFGLGARGFNQYDGTVEKAIFHSITTYGDGSIGVQISKPVGTIEVKGFNRHSWKLGENVGEGRADGSSGNGLSVKEGGEIRSLIVAGGVTTYGDKVTTMEVEGRVLKLSVAKGFTAKGSGSKALTVSPGVRFPLGSTRVSEKRRRASAC
jgi:hypothetical protein